jgi:hypothetical protein
MVISLGPKRDRPRRRLRGGSRLPASASNLLAADSEIAAGRIALFTPVNRYWSLLLSRGLPRANLDCRRPVSRAPPRLSPGTRALCSSDFPLAPKRQRPSLPTPCLGCQRAAASPWVSGCSGVEVSGDTLTPSPSHPETRSPSESAVPKGRFELPRGYPHYALNVARLPVPPLRLVTCSLPTGPEPTSGLEPETCCLRNSCSTN